MGVQFSYFSIPNTRWLRSIKISAVRLYKPYFQNSPRDIHFFSSDYVTDNCILDLKEKSVFATLLCRYYFGSFHLSHKTTRYL